MNFSEELSKLLDSYGYMDSRELEELRVDTFKMPPETFLHNILLGIAEGTFSVEMGSVLTDKKGWDEYDRDEPYLVHDL